MKVLVAILISTFSLFLNAQPKELLKLEIKNIGPLINSAYSDYTPLVSADGSIMVFSSNRPATKTSISNTTTTAKGTFSAIYITYFNDKSKSWLEPVLLEPVVNLQGVDNSAIALSNDGQRMLIYRTGLNKNINKGIYETTLNGNDWSVPKRLPSPINSDGNENSASFSPDGKTIYFVSNRIGGIGGQDIWYCTQNNSGEWDEAINLGESINTKEDEESVFLHPNGNSLFFSSKGHNSMGGYDIFVSHYDTLADVWTKAESMGASINTPVNDLDFVLTASGKVGYYTSIKPKGLGDKDIYSVAFENNILKKEIRLLKGFITDENGLGVNAKIIIKDKLTGTVINSIKSNLATGKYIVPLQLHQEYEINVTDNNNGTYTDFIEVSDKTNYHEIVKNVVLVPKFANVLSRVLDENGDPVSNVQIELIDVITKQLIGKFESNKSGGTRFSVPFDNKYNIVFSKPGYLFHSINISIPKSVGSELKDIKNIILQKAEVGKKTALNNIPFDFDQSLPGQQSYMDLDRVILLMKQMLSLQVEISGHTANVGFQDNKKLSEQMAKSVMGYLIDKGVEKNRLKYIGYGSSEPLTDNDTEEGRETNNRIEIKVLKVDLIAEQLAEELRIKNNVANVKSDDTVQPSNDDELQDEDVFNIDVVKEDERADSIVKNETIETKEADVADVKELESTDDAVETETIETKEADVADVKELEGTDDAIETETIETEDADIADVKEDESTDDAVETETIKTNEADIADVKEVESTTVALETETTETTETKEADIADIKEVESTDAPAETETIETNEPDIADVKEQESTDAAVETETIETKEADIADEKEVESTDAAVDSETIESDEADTSGVKELESTDTAVETETTETKESDIVDVKEFESTDTAVDTEIVETKEADIAGVKEGESTDTALETTSIETMDADLADEKELESTDVAPNTETTETNEADVVDVKKVENAETTEEGQVVQESKETDVSSLNQLENKNLSSDSQKIEIKNIGSLVNTSFPDFGPFISADGLTMILSSRLPLDQKDLLKGKEGNANIYITHFDDKSKSWLKTTMLEPAINMPGIDNYAVALSNDGQRMLFYRGGNDKNVKTDIFESVLKGDEWSVPVVLPPPVNSQDNETSASISPDGKTIYFVSDRTGGFGGKDIWYSTQSKSGKWSSALNMGESVNSSEDEEYIFIHPNGSTLFFSSKGHNSMGGYDLFMFEVGDSSNTGSKPQSLGSAINTINDDIYFVLAADGITAYYSAAESKGAKGSDIYSVTFSENIINKNAVLLKGRIMDEYGAFLKSKITITDKSTDSKVGVYTSNSALGKYLITLPTDKEYEIKVTAKGYTTFKDSIETSNKAGYKEYVKNVLLEPKNAFIISKTVDDNGFATSARIELFDKNKKQLIEKSKTDNDGISRISVPSGKTFEIIFTKPGYFFQSLNVLIPNAIGYEKNLKNITLQKVESRKIVQLNNVAFESNQAILTRESFSDLDRVVSLMNDLVSLKIEIGDNSCNSASGKPDKILSKEKAKAVVDYLISKGIDKNRLVFKSYIAKGKSPDSNAKSETGSIQLKVLKIDSKSEQIAVEKLIQEAVLADNQRDESDGFEGDELENTDLIEGENQYTDASNEEYNYSDEGYNEEYTDTTGSGEYSNEEYSDSAYEEYSEENFDEANPYDDGLSADSLMMEIKNIGSVVNSAFQDYLPLVHADGNAMIFTSNRLTNEMLPPATSQAKKRKGAKKDDKAGKSNIYATYYDVKNKKWLSPKMLGPTINLPGINNSAIALSNDGQKMLLYRNDKDQEGNGDIFESTLNGEEWTNPLRLPSSINSEDNETSASISPDGKTIYFVSNRKLGFGEKDIWFCTKEKSGIWAQAVNIGDYINTEKDEESVFIHPNGNSLFFSSKGHNTIGGYDIFISNFDSLSGQWGEARNLGKAINTTDDDLYFVLSANGKAGYYASSKTKGFGETDIYSVVVGDDIIKKNTTIVKGFITDEDGEGIKSKIEITDKTTDEPMGVFNSNKISGKYLISLPTGKKYEIKVASDGYTSYAMSIDITNKLDYNEILKNIVLEAKNAFISSRMFNESGKPISVQVEAVDNNSLQLIDRSVSDNEGYSRIAVPSGKNLDIFYTKPGYLFQSINVVIPKSTGFESKNLRNITMQKAEVGKKTMLNTVSFENNQTIPRQESFLDLDRVIALMNDMGSLEIEISVYTYNVGSERDNVKLSKERAKALVDRLISKGCDKKRLSFKGYSSKMPFNTNDTEEGRKENNRTELKVLKMDVKAEQAALEKRIATTITVDVGNDVKPDEIIVSADEVKIQKNKEIVVIADKNIENIDSVNVAKTQENTGSVVSSDTKNETIDSLEQEKTQDNIETVVTADENEAPADSIENEKTEENRESVVAADENEATIDPVENEKTQENVETIVADDENEATIDPIEEEETQDISETIVTADENEAPVDPIEEEKTQENIESIVTADENEAPADSIENEKTQENVESVVTADENEAAIDPVENEKTQDNIESTVNDAVNKNEPFDPFEEEEKLEAQKALVTDVKEDEPFDPFEEEEKLEAQKALVTNVKEDEPFDPFEEEEKLEAQKALVTDVKKDEPFDPFEDEEKLENTKADASNIEQNDSLNTNAEVPGDVQKVSTESTLPEHFKQFDNDLNGVISYDEILKMIDSFFEDDPNVKSEDISSLIDYFFEG